MIRKNQYDFDTVIERRQTDSIKWNLKDTELPMWVADMDFPAAPEIVQAFAQRLQHPVFGYSKLPVEWYDAYLGWWERRHHFSMTRRALTFCTGVVPAISSMIRQLTVPGDQIIMLTPIYNHFYHCIRENGRQVLEVEMDFDGDAYRIDPDRLETALSQPTARLMILCNPQNPTGTIWQRNELQMIGELCDRHHVTVIADEIHCDIISPGKEYIPFASVSEICSRNSITCIAPTKAFNLAGLQSAALYIPDPHLRGLVKAGIQRDELAMPNSFSTTAAVAAFTKGEAWLDELNAYLLQNKLIVRDYLRKEIPEVRLVWGDATYLLWLDLRTLHRESREIVSVIRSHTGLYLMPGSDYGKGGSRFLRMNIACPRSLLLDGLERLKTGVGVLISDSGGIE